VAIAENKDRTSGTQSLRDALGDFHAHADAHATSNDHTARNKHAARHIFARFSDAAPIASVRDARLDFHSENYHSKCTRDRCRCADRSHSANGDYFSNGDRHANIHAHGDRDDRNPYGDRNTHSDRDIHAHTHRNTHGDTHTMTRFPVLSVVIPVYNEERRLEKSLDACFRFLPSNFSSWELIAVDDGSSDGTWDLLEKHKRIFNHFQIIRNSHRGKGYAVKTGMLFARGEYRLFMDCDLSTPLEEIVPAMRAIREADLVIGSRELKRSKVKTTFKRRLMGRVFHAFASDLVDGIRDTQCGFKMFRDYVAQDIFRDQRLEGMAFDVELLWLALQKGYTVHEMPVAWIHDPDSRVRIMGDSLQMLRDVINIPNLHKVIDLARV